MPEKKHSWFGETWRTALYAGLIAVAIRTFAFEPFNIPSESMLPTLLVGDYLFVSKFSYGYSRHSLPFSPPLFSGRILASEPERGDVAVFKLPRDNSQDYIKRIVGLPGDRVQVRDGLLYVNDKLVDRKSAGEFSSPNSFGASRVYKRYIETLPNGKTYSVLDLHADAEGDNTQIFVVPAGHYFAMGDNRDNSLDSRVSPRHGRGGVGFIPAENLVGRAEFLFFSTDGSARLWEPWRWIQAARFSRFFRSIE